MLQEQSYVGRQSNEFEKKSVGKRNFSQFSFEVYKYCCEKHHHSGCVHETEELVRSLKCLKLEQTSAPISEVFEEKVKSEDFKRGIDKTLKEYYENNTKSLEKEIKDFIDSKTYYEPMNNVLAQAYYEREMRKTQSRCCNSYYMIEEEASEGISYFDQFPQEHYKSNNAYLRQLFFDRKLKRMETEV